MQEIREALNKKAKFGEDLDLRVYGRKAKKRSRVSELSKVPHEILKSAYEVGVREKERAGSFFQIDHSAMLSKVNEKFEGQVEVMTVKDALKKYPWLRDYYWKAVDVTADKYTARAELEFDDGYFFRILKGAKVTFPLQSCLFIAQRNFNQNVHNIIIAEENSKAQIITGCTLHQGVERALHIGISEFFIRKNAKLTFTMIHRWNDNADVRPRTVALVDDNATFASNYILLNPVRSLQMYPAVFCNGKNSVARLNSIIHATRNTNVDIGSKIVLNGENSRGEVVSRVIGRDSSGVIARGMLEGNVKTGKAHLECRGLLLSDNAYIHSIPELIGRKEGVDLSHEAAVGKIADKEINYLRARGLNEEEATALIVRGFLDVRIMGLPEKIEDEIRKLVDVTTEEAM